MKLDWAGGLNPFILIGNFSYCMLGLFLSGYPLDGKLWYYRLRQKTKQNHREGTCVVLWNLKKKCLFPFLNYVFRIPSDYCHILQNMWKCCTDADIQRKATCFFLKRSNQIYKMSRFLLEKNQCSLTWIENHWAVDYDGADHVDDEDPQHIVPEGTDEISARLFLLWNARLIAVGLSNWHKC